MLRECWIGFGGARESWNLEVIGESCVNWAGTGNWAMALGTIAVSFWNRDLFATTSRLNWWAVYVPSRIGAMKVGQRREHTERKEKMSRPECFARESQTVEQNRVQTSLVSRWPLGSCGLGSVKERI